MNNLKKLLWVVLMALAAFSTCAQQQYDPESDFAISILDGGKSAVITKYVGSKWNVRIPMRIQGVPVTSIGFYAFFECTKLTSVTIPNSVTSIGIRGADYFSDGGGAFYGCTSLASITIPDSVTSIGEMAFQDCTRLASVTIPNSVTHIGSEAFEGTPWLNNQPNGLVYAGKVVLTYKGTMPANTSIIISNGTKGIAGGAFSGCNRLTMVNIPDSVTSIGNWAFQGCTSLTSVTIPNSVTNIGEMAFQGCTRLASVTIPNSVTSIGECAFQDCTRLASLTIPNSVTRIGSGAFEGTAWLNNQPNGLIYAGKVALKYKGAMPANTRINISNGTKEIADDAFKDCTNLTSITIPDSVTSIGNGAFYYCTSLTSITIPKSVTHIDAGAFFYCDSLISVTFLGTIDSANFILGYVEYCPPFPGDLNGEFYAINAKHGTPGTYTRPNGKSETWTKQP
jgi:hypothetical protein